MSDQSTPQSEGKKFSELRLSRLEMLWNESWSYLSKGLMISALIHLLLALPVLFSPSVDTDLDVAWEGRFADLAGIGHGMDDFDEMEDVDWDDLEDMDVDPAEEFEEFLEDYELPDDQEEFEEEEELVEEEEESADEEVEDEEAEPASDPDAEEQPEPGPEPDPEPDSEPATEQATQIAEDAEEIEKLPGIDRSSPSNLPDLRNYGPGNARVTALVRTDRFRDTELEPYVEDILRAVPDYYIALEGIDLDPVEEFDSIFMASANPDYLHETFLAVRHRFETEDLQNLLDSRFEEQMEWEIDDERPLRRLVPETVGYHDPRRLLLAHPGLALIGQPAWFEDVLGPVDEDSDLGRELADAEEGPSTFALLDGLARIEEVAEDEETLVLVSAYGFRLRDIPMVDSIPPFDAARLAITDADNPKLTIDLRMRTEQEARDLERNCPRLRSQLNMVLRFVGLASVVRPLECSRDGSYVIVEGQYTAEEVRNLLERAEPMIEAIHPRSLRELPEGPRSAEEDDSGWQDDEDEEDQQEEDHIEGEIEE